MNECGIQFSADEEDSGVIAQPTSFQSVTVVNLQKERNTPYTNGTINPITNAAIVGSTKSGQYFFNGFDIESLTLEQRQFQ